ncbi:MAG: hypothetical protein AAFO77_10925 [Pseudomonadota bacterium]
MTNKHTRRRDKADVTPLIEDQGLFARPPIEVAIEFVPRVGKNDRGDTVIVGYVSDSASIEVVFAGRRAGQAQPLIAALKALWTSANLGSSSRAEPPNVGDVRLRAKVFGSWRPRFPVDAEGWQECEFQLLAAKWTYSPRSGVAETFGELPQL